jgi:hypothetical protein
LFLAGNDSLDAASYSNGRSETCATRREQAELLRQIATRKRPKNATDAAQMAAKSNIPVIGFLPAKLALSGALGPETIESLTQSIGLRAA